MSTTTLGYSVSAPFGIGKIYVQPKFNYKNNILLWICLLAPTAMQRMAHPDGECATAKGLYAFVKYF